MLRDPPHLPMPPQWSSSVYVIHVPTLHPFKTSERHCTRKRNRGQYQGIGFSAIKGMDHELFWDQDGFLFYHNNDSFHFG